VIEFALATWTELGPPRGFWEVERSIVDGNRPQCSLTCQWATWPDIWPGRIMQVEWFLDAPSTEQTRVDAVTYYARLLGTADPDSDLNVGVRQRSAETGSEGSAAVSSRVESALARLESRLRDEPTSRDVGIAHRPGEVMTLDDYLHTPCVELAVHIDDLAQSSDIPTPAPESTVSLAVDLLISAARQRHGDRAMLLALTRRERDVLDAARVL